MIFYFTGTGNSLYAAKHFDKELYSIPQEMKRRAESIQQTGSVLSARFMNSICPALSKTSS